MDIIKNIKDVLALQNHYEKRSKLEYLSDVFEYNKWLEAEDVAEGVKILLFFALKEKEQDVKESFFHTINNAVVYHQKEDIGHRINWDTLINSLSALDKWQLEYALNILSLSGQERYLPILREYTHSADPEIREWASDAIGEIKYRLAHASGDQIKTK